MCSWVDRGEWMQKDGRVESTRFVYVTRIVRAGHSSVVMKFLSTVREWNGTITVNSRRETSSVMTGAGVRIMELREETPTMESIAETEIISRNAGTKIVSTGGMPTNRAMAPHQVAPMFLIGVTTGPGTTRTRPATRKEGGIFLTGATMVSLEIKAGR